MKCGMVTLLSKSVRLWCSRLGIVMYLMICLAFPIFAQDEENIKSIHVVTPSWEGYTNKDGTGLWFEILRAVYEPVGIQMTYEFVPWKRAMDEVLSNKSDAILGEYENENLLMPRYPLDVERTAVVFTRENIKAWNGLKTLEGKNVVWLRGYDYHLVDELEGIQLNWYEIDDRKQAWKMLERGRVDFFMDALSDIEQSIEDNTIDMTPYQIEIVWTTNVYVGFAQSGRAEKLVEIYDKRIAELLESDELQKLFEKWQVEFPEFKPNVN